LRKYFYTDGKNKFGPYSLEFIQLKKLSPNTMVWYYGLDEWVPISTLDEFSKNYQKKEINRKPNLELTFKIQICIAILAFILFIFFILMKLDIFSNNNIRNSVIESNEDFQMYVDKFYRDLEVNGISKIRPKKQIISLANLDQHIESNHIHAISLGKDKDDLIEIYINKTSWDNFNKAQKYYVMYHELSHDVLNLDDLPDLPEFRGQLMYPKIDSYESISMDDFIESFYKTFEDYKLKM
jgi:hypothetical protein